jgi:hypothetical protein
MFQVCNVLVIKLKHKTQINDGSIQDVPWPKKMLKIYTSNLNQ